MKDPWTLRMNRCFDVKGKWTSSLSSVLICGECLSTRKGGVVDTRKSIWTWPLCQWTYGCLQHEEGVSELSNTETLGGGVQLGCVSWNEKNKFTDETTDTVTSIFRGRKVSHRDHSRYRGRSRCEWIFHFGSSHIFQGFDFIGWPKKIEGGVLKKKNSIFDGRAGQRATLGTLNSESFCERVWLTRQSQTQWNSDAGHASDESWIHGVHEENLPKHTLVGIRVADTYVRTHGLDVLVDDEEEEKDEEVWRLPSLLYLQRLTLYTIQ